MGPFEKNDEVTLLHLNKRNEVIGTGVVMKCTDSIAYDESQYYYKIRAQLRGEDQERTIVLPNTRMIKTGHVALRELRKRCRRDHQALSIDVPNLLVCPDCKVPLR